MATLKSEKANMKDIDFLNGLAKRLSDMMYYHSSELIPMGLLHDDYDLLRKLAKKLEIEFLQDRLNTLSK